MSDRMNTMFNHADAFIALLGGLGTLKEIFHISSRKMRHCPQCPKVESWSIEDIT